VESGKQRGRIGLLALDGDAGLFAAVIDMHLPYTR
jgi:hypothetical protein